MLGIEAVGHAVRVIDWMDFMRRGGDSEGGAGASQQASDVGKAVLSDRGACQGVLEAGHAACCCAKGAVDIARERERRGLGHASLPQPLHGIRGPGLG